MAISPTLFLQVTNHLFTRHFSIGINDTWIHEGNVQELIENGARPFEVVNDHAEDCDLVRTDIEGFYGVPEFRPLTAAEERVALLELQPFEVERDKFEEQIYKAYFIKNISSDLQLSSECMTKAELCKRQSDDYERKDISAAWFGWKQALEARGIKMGDNLLFVVHSQGEADLRDGAGYWSAEMGWTTLGDATVFDANQIQHLTLPESAGQDARLVNLNEAKAPAPAVSQARRPIL